jgi:hypothetical protein
MDMHRFLPPVLAAILACATPASAETIERMVKANTLTAVGGLFTYGVQSCLQGAIPDAKVGRPPKNGTVVVRMHQTILGKHTNCAGQKVSGPIFIYTPKRGFKGIDEFTIEYPFARSETSQPTLMSTTYRLTVQ